MVFLTGWFFVCGCEPTEEPSTTTGTTVPSTQVENSVQKQPPAQEDIVDAEKQALAKALSSRIASGQFKAASEILDGIKTIDSQELIQIKKIIAANDSLQQRREEAKAVAHKEQVEEFEKLRDEIGIDGISEKDPNSFGDIFTAIVRVREYSEPDKKDEILSDPFMQELIKTTEETASKFEAEGEWLDAYAYGYYWLKTLYKDNEEYKEQVDDLLEKAMVAASLKDSGCETGIERHEGIIPDMYLKALAALDSNYVERVEYLEMAKEAIARCKILAQTIAVGDEEIAYKIDTSHLQDWIDGLEEYEEKFKAEKFYLSKDRFMGIFVEIFELNAATVAIPQELLIAQFAEASFEALDPFTTLVWPWAVQDFQKSMTQGFDGIGIQMLKEGKKLKVTSLIPNTPAYFSGLDAEDEIVAVDGTPMADVSSHCAVKKISGPKGTDVTLTIKRSGQEGTQDITITRGRIVVPSIRGWRRDDDLGKWQYWVDEANKIGYVKISSFVRETGPDFEKVLRQLESEGMQGLIIDLRYNPGGLLLTAADIVDNFVSKGLIVKSQPRWAVTTRHTAHKAGTHPDYPLVVLINGSSASASEIVAGALQDQKFKRATLVGSRSYGKGSVQTITDYTGDNSQLKYTMAYYYLPSEQKVKNRYIVEKQGRDDWGIAPDVEIKLKTNEKIKMIEVQNANEVLTKADHDDEDEPTKRYSLQETLKSDPQLEMGVLVMQSKMIAQGQAVVVADPVVEEKIAADTQKKIENKTE